MNLMETVIGSLKSDSLSKISQAIGADEVSTSRGIAATVPALISALANKASQPGGESALLSMVQQDADIDIVENMEDYLGNPLAAGGSNMLRNVMGDGQEVAETQIAKASGLAHGLVSRLLPLVAPIVLGMIGKMVMSQKLDAAGLSKYLGDQQGYIRSSQPGLLGFLEKIDANDDGSIVDDLGRLAGRLFGRAA